MVMERREINMLRFSSNLRKKSDIYKLIPGQNMIRIPTVLSLSKNHIFFLFFIKESCALGLKI